MKLTEEYILLYNSITDAVETLKQYNTDVTIQNLVDNLIEVQQKAEEIVISKTEEQR